MEKSIKLKLKDPINFFGSFDSYIKFIESEFSVIIIFRDEIVKIKGENFNVENATKVLKEMMEIVSKRGSVSIENIKDLIMIIKSKDININKISNLKDDISPILNGKKGVVLPRTNGQIEYIKLIKNNDITFSIGPAGTGKTFLAIVYAVSLLENEDVDKIILCRPAVEAGENLGFLPGDLKEKVDPYLIPLYDALGKILPKNKLKRLFVDNFIEIVPLAYMRGRTLENSCMILDEAQNTTIMQMKMFLTRLGIGSQAIITGDITQVDLKKKSHSGLIQIIDILKGIKGIGFIKMKRDDVVRHSLVKDIIKAFDERK